MEVPNRLLKDQGSFLKSLYQYSTWVKSAVLRQYQGDNDEAKKLELTFIMVVVANFRL